MEYLSSLVATQEAILVETWWATHIVMRHTDVAEALAVTLASMAELLVDMEALLTVMATITQLPLGFVANQIAGKKLPSVIAPGEGCRGCLKEGRRGRWIMMGLGWIISIDLGGLPPSCIVLGC